MKKSIYIMLFLLIVLSLGACKKNEQIVSDTESVNNEENNDEKFPITFTDDEVSKLVTNMKDKTEFILSRVKGLESKRVFFENWHDPLSSVGPGSFIDEMITMSGGENIASDLKSSYGEFSEELVLERDPEIYLTVDDGFKTVEDIKARTGYSELTAVKNEKIYFLDPDITIRPGPRIVQTLENIARAIHPGEFQDK